jgi:type VI secretion system secreted protein Hcp
MADVDIFLKLDGVDGESADPDHKNEIQLDGFSVNCTAPRDSFTGQATGVRRWSHLSMRAKVDKSTPLLYQKLTSNATIPSAILTCRKAGKQQFTYFKITLSDVLVAKVEAGDLQAGDSAIPKCDFDLSFKKIEISAQSQTTLGTMGGQVVMQDDLSKAK